MYHSEYNIRKAKRISSSTSSSVWSQTQPTYRKHTGYINVHSSKRRDGEELAQDIGRQIKTKKCLSQMETCGRQPSSETVWVWTFASSKCYKTWLRSFSETWNATKITDCRNQWKKVSDPHKTLSCLSHFYTHPSLPAQLTPELLLIIPTLSSFATLL